MNGGGASGTGPRGAAATPLRDPQSDERARETASALWLALAQRVEQATPPAALGEAEPPSAWRASAGDLTPGSQAGALSAGAGGEGERPERMVLRVDGGALGELEVTLERDGGGLNLIIGLENRDSVGRVLPDARILQGALERAGVSVQSLRVVPASEVGTVLAQRRLSPSGPRSGSTEQREPEPEQEQRQKHKRITLIG